MDIFNILFAVAVTCSAALFASVMALVPATGLSISKPERRYYTIKVSRTLVKRIEIVDEPVVGYEHANQRDRMIARFNPFQFATSEEVEMWDGIKDEDKGGEEYTLSRTTTFRGVVGSMHDFMEAVDMTEPTLSPNVLAALNAYHTPVVNAPKMRSPEEIVMEMKALMGEEYVRTLNETMEIFSTVATEAKLFGKSKPKKASKSAAASIKQTKGPKPKTNVAGPDVFRNVVQTNGPSGNVIHAK